jgi:nucleoside-diphosphate-sugar epimerase
MRLLVSGGSSFVGAWFCLRAAAHHDVFALHHATPLALPGVTPIRADLRRPRALRLAREVEPDAVVHLAAKVKGPDALALNRQMMAAMLELGRPIVYASSTVVHWKRETAYGTSRREGEAALAESGLPFAIVRPSAPYGPRLIGHAPGHTESFHTLANLVRRSRVVPVIGDGQYRRQPIHVDDLSDTILALLERGLTGQALDAGGANALTFDQIIGTIADAAGRRVARLHLPKALFALVAGRSADFDPELIDAIDEDEIADPAALTAATGIRPRAFAVGAPDLLL